MKKELAPVGNDEIKLSADGVLDDEQLNAVTGGIIFVGGSSPISQPTKGSITHADWQTLNPQPIPPGKNQQGGKVLL